MANKISKERVERILAGGLEPSFDGVSCTQEELDFKIVKGLVWYRENYKSVSSKQWVIAYLKSIGRAEDAALCAKGSNSIIKYTAPLCRMVSRGLVLPSKHQTTMDKNLQELLSNIKNRIEKHTDASNIQERIHAKADSFLCDLESILDVVSENIRTGNKNIHPLVEWIKKTEWTRPIINIIRERLNRSLTEWKLVETDPDLAEGYSHLKKKQLKNLIAEVETADTHLASIFDEQISHRKPRKKKKKSPDQLVKGLYFCPKNIEFDVASVNPCDIIGCQGFIMYNEKNKKATVFVAQVPKDGLSVKGSTIIGFDPAKSFEKTVRKIEEFMKDAKKVPATFASLCKHLSLIKTKPSSPKGRVNDHCVILKVGA